MAQHIGPSLTSIEGIRASLTDMVTKGATFDGNASCFIKELEEEVKNGAKLILVPNAYANGKVFAFEPGVGAIDVDVVRNVTKTRVNSLGLIESSPANVLAPDYLNGVCPALNVEGQVTNLNTFSEDFQNSSYLKDNTTISSNTTATIAPDGTNNADVLLETSQTSFFQIRKDYFLNDDTVYSFSVFLKKLGRNDIRLYVRTKDNIINNVFWNFSSESFSNISTGVQAFSTKLINDWYRLTISINVNSGITTPRFSCQLTDFGSTVYFGDTSKGLYFFGFDVKKEDKPSSYIPTTTAQVTRSADNVTVPIPSGTTEIIEKYEDGTTNTITTIPASPYTVPVGRITMITMK